MIRLQARNGWNPREYLMFATSKSDGSVTENKDKTHENIKDPLDQR